MEVENITSGTKEKKFLFTTVENGSYNVDVITITDKEIEAGALVEKYGVYGDDKYSIMSSGSYISEWEITRIDVGDILDIDGSTTVTRLA